LQVMRLMMRTDGYDAIKPKAFDPFKVGCRR